jgi:hypothetical protein
VLFFGQQVLIFWKNIASLSRSTNLLCCDGHAKASAVRIRAIAGAVIGTFTSPWCWWQVPARRWYRRVGAPSMAEGNGIIAPFPQDRWIYFRAAYREGGLRAVQGEADSGGVTRRPSTTNGIGRQQYQWALGEQ